MACRHLYGLPYGASSCGHHILNDYDRSSASLFSCIPHTEVPPLLHGLCPNRTARQKIALLTVDDTEANSLDFPSMLIGPLSIDGQFAAH